MDSKLENLIKLAKTLDEKGKKEKNDDAAVHKRMSAKDAVSNLRSRIAGSRLKIVTSKTPEEKSAAWRKTAQSGLDKCAVDFGQLVHKGEDRLGEYWESLSPETKNVLLSTLVGSAVGGIGGAGAGAALAPEGHTLSQAIGTGASGALLGGAAGGAGAAGLQALTGGRSLPAETKGKALSDRMSEAVIGTAMHNPALTAGTGIGGATTLHEIHNLMTKAPAKKGKDVKNALDMLLNPDLHKLPARDMLDVVAHTGMSGAKLMGLPAGVVLGYLADKYIRGDYD